MHQAVKKILGGELNLTQAALRYQIPKSTLFDRIRDFKANKELSFVPNVCRKKTNTAYFEKLLVSRLKKEKRLLTVKQFKTLALQLAKEHNIKNAGNSFYATFIKMHCELIRQKPKQEHVDDSDSDEPDFEHLETTNS